MSKITKSQAKYLCMKNNPGKIVTISPTNNPKTCENGFKVKFDKNECCVQSPHNFLENNDYNNTNTTQVNAFPQNSGKESIDKYFDHPPQIGVGVWNGMWAHSGCHVSGAPTCPSGWTNVNDKWCAGGRQATCLYVGQSGDKDMPKCCIADPSVLDPTTGQLDAQFCNNIAGMTPEDDYQQFVSHKDIDKLWTPWSTSCVLKDQELDGGLYKDFCSGLDEAGNLRIQNGNNCELWCGGLKKYTDTKTPNECDNIKVEYCTQDKDQDIDKQDSACACMNYVNSKAYQEWYKILNKESKSFQKDPVCWAPPCLQPGSLKTTQMQYTKDTQCDSSVTIDVCETIFNLAKNGKVIIDKNNFSNNCGSSKKLPPQKVWKCNTDKTCVEQTEGEPPGEYETADECNRACNWYKCDEYGKTCIVSDEKTEYTDASDCGCPSPPIVSKKKILILLIFIFIFFLIYYFLKTVIKVK